MTDVYVKISENETKKTDTCYICLQENDLFRPCGCTKLVHKKCLDEWRRYQLNTVPYPLLKNKYKNFQRCEICNAFYRDKLELDKPRFSFRTMVFIDIFSICILLAVCYIGFGTFLHYMDFRVRNNDVENIALIGFVTTHVLLSLFYIFIWLIREESMPNYWCCMFTSSVGGTESSDITVCIFCLVLFVLAVVVNFIVIFVDVYEKRREQYKVFEIAERTVAPQVEVVEQSVVSQPEIPEQLETSV